MVSSHYPPGSRLRPGKIRHGHHPAIGNGARL